MLAVLPSESFWVLQEPESECAPSQATGAVVQPICGSSVVWSDTMSPGVCNEGHCTFTDFMAVLNFCSGPVIQEVKFPGQDWQALSGSGPHQFNLSGNLNVDCGEHVTKTTRFRTSTGTEGSLEMVFTCWPSP